MKNKNLVLGLIVGLLIIVFGIGAYFLAQNKAGNSSVKETLKAPTTNSTKSAESTLKELIASKVPVKCSYSTDAGTAKIAGTVYVSGGKIRGDFSTMAGKTEIKGHMATDEKYVYTWTDGTNQGYKFAIDTNAEAKGTTSDSNSQKPDFNQKFNYSCTPWVPDNKMLELPQNVTFTTFSLPGSQALPTGSSINNQSACQACSGLPAGEAKTMCLTQLKCSQ